MKFQQKWNNSQMGMQRRLHESISSFAASGLTIGECGHDNRIYIIRRSGFTPGTLISSNDPKLGYADAVCDENDLWWHYVKWGRGSLSFIVDHFNALAAAAAEHFDDSD